MANYKLCIAYDGTKYNGYQKQIKHPEKTIQGKLENVLSLLFEEPIQIIGCGRTDAGVHAKGSVCNFHSKKELAFDTILEYLRTYLPQDIAVLDISLASERFHSRYNVVRKCYSYTIDTGYFPDPFQLRYRYHLPETLDIEAMQKASQDLLGEHDFKSFTSLKSKTKSTVRTIHRIDITPVGQTVVLTFEGNGFLQHMVRILTGTLIEIGLHKRPADCIPQLLASKERMQSGYKVPSQGLCMEKVYY